MLYAVAQLVCMQVLHEASGVEFGLLQVVKQSSPVHLPAPSWPHAQASMAFHLVASAPVQTFFGSPPAKI